MEQRLDATYLRPGPFERSAAVGFCAVAIGAGILLAAWGISFLWRYTPPEIRIANPEISVTQKEPLKIEPLKIDPPEIRIANPEISVIQKEPLKIEPLKTDPPEVTIKTEQSGEMKTPAGDVIKREVTVFWSVTHELGEVVTGWKYADGRGGNPVRQYCYYSAPNADHSSRRVDIASNRIPSPNNNGGLVPDLEGALAKCQWGRE